MRDCSEDKFYNVATLVFDEMKVKNTYEFDKKQQTVIGNEILIKEWKESGHMMISIQPEICLLSTAGRQAGLQKKLQFS